MQKFLHCMVLIVLIAVFLTGDKYLVADDLRNISQFQNPSNYHNYNYYYDFEFSYNSRITNQLLGEAEKSLLFYAVLPDKSPQSRRFVEGLQIEAKNQRVGMMIAYSDGSENRQKELILDAIQKKVDAMILFTIDDSKIYEEISKLKHWNIPIIAVWDTVDPQCYDLIDTFVGMDKSEIGSLLAGKIADYEEDYKTILFIAEDSIQDMITACTAKLNIYSQEFEFFTEHISELGSNMPKQYIENGNLLVVCLAADYNAVKQFYKNNTNVRYFIADEESQVRSIVSEVAGTESLFYYSRMEDGMLAVNMAINSAGGKKSPVHVQMPLKEIGDRSSKTSGGE